MKKKHKRAFVWLFLILCYSGGWPVWVTAQIQTYHTASEQGQQVRFLAQHSLGPVDGTLQPVRGSLIFDPAVPTEGLKAHFTADMTSFDTGLGMRDKDMKNNYLETERYPEAVFVLDDARPTMLAAQGDTIRLAVTGSMTLHGVTQPHTVEATLIPSSAGFTVQASFPLLLSDYQIRQPRRFFMGVEDQIKVEILLNLSRQ